MISTKHCQLVSLAAILCVVVGCGSGGKFASDLGAVSGKVTLDGAPLENATLDFTPTGSGAGGSSSGSTDAAGNYVMYFSPSDPGAWIGSHTVTISKEETDAATEQTLQYVPPKYNTETELTADVKQGENTIDFALESGGFEPKAMNAEEF